MQILSRARVHTTESQVDQRALQRLRQYLCASIMQHFGDYDMQTLAEVLGKFATLKV